MHTNTHAEGRPTKRHFGLQIKQPPSKLSNFYFINSENPSGEKSQIVMTLSY